MENGIIVGIFVTLMVLREMIPLILRMQQRRRSDPPPPPQQPHVHHHVPPPPSAPRLSSPEDITVGEVFRRQQESAQHIERIRSILREQPKEVEDAIRRYLEKPESRRRRRVDEDD